MPLCDPVLRLAAAELFEPYWSDTNLDEVGAPPRKPAKEFGGKYDDTKSDEAGSLPRSDNYCMKPLIMVAFKRYHD